MTLSDPSWKFVGIFGFRPIVSALLVFGCLLSTLGAQAASITLGSTNIASGATFTVPLTTDSGSQPLGRYEAFISYDSNVLQVVNYASATPNFSGPNVNTNIAGEIKVVCDSSSGSLNFPTGVLQVAQITFQAIGSPGNSSPLSFNSFVLYNAQTVAEIPASANDGLVSILTVPTANFTGTPTSGLASLDVTFSDTSTGTITNRFWDFGDGNTLNTGATSVPHTYDAEGTYSVSLTVTGPGGSNTFTRNSYIVASSVPPPPPELTVTPANINFGTVATGQTNTQPFSVINTGGQTLTGTATVAGPFAIRNGSPFNISSGQTGTVNVSFIPVSSGNFSNNVVFSSNGGGSTNLVQGTGAIVPSASFSGTPTTGLAPLSVTFTDTSTGTITNRFWNFGDGTSTNTSATSVPNTYNSTGTNTVTLIVSGPLGASTNSKSAYIIVTNLPPPQLNVAPVSLDFGTLVLGQTNTLPFSVINTGGIALTGTASVAGPFSIKNGSPYNVAPGQTGTVNISFIPVSSGTATNTVVFNSNGGSSSNAVTGAAVAPGGLAVSPVGINFGTIATGTTAQASFVVTNTGGSTINGTASVGSAPFAIASGTPFNLAAGAATNVVVNFTPTGEGGFTNSVIFTGGGGSTNTVTGVGAISPEASFTANKTNGVAPLGVTFTDTSTGTITSRFWNFGDNSTTNTTATSVDHTYSAGTNTVTLIVSGPLGASTNTIANYIAVTNPVAPDTTAPSLAILTPSDNEAFTNANITVTGTADDASGIKDVTVGGAAAALNGTNWSKSFTLSSGTNLITVIARDNSAAMNATTQFVHAIFTPLQSGTDTNAPTVQITSPTNGLVTAQLFIDVTGNAQDDNLLASVVVTNNRGGSVDAIIAGTNWTSSGVALRLGTNLLFAVASDGFTNSASDMVTVVRVGSNYVNTSLRVNKAQLTLGDSPNSDQLKVDGTYNDSNFLLDPTTDAVEVMFGDYDATVPPNSIVKLKYKAKASPTNTLTALSFKTKKRAFSFSASGFTLTNGDPFVVAIGLGTNDLGPDSISFALPGSNAVGKFAYAFGAQLPNVDQFFVNTASISSKGFTMTGTIHIGSQPDPRASALAFGVGSFDESLPVGGWVKGAGNNYTYARPNGFNGAVTSMTLDLDSGEWSVAGTAGTLDFLFANPTTDVRVEIADFAASYPLKLVVKGTKLSYK